MPCSLRVLVAVLVLPAVAPIADPQAAKDNIVVIHNADELKSALAAVQADSTLRIAPGEFSGGHFVRDVERLTIEALDPKSPPHFKGGSVAWHFSRCSELTLRNLKISGQKDNGLNFDDGGDLERPVRGLTIEHVEISDIGPRGNHDGIKASGLTGAVIRDCTISGWGGQGIDFVGCHKSLVSTCRFVGKDGFTATAAIQIKGGSSEITVEKCQFTDAGERPINVGGSTGAAYFRPQNATCEASRVIIRENQIEGGLCATAFVGVDEAEFTGNTILFPKKWVFRILQENTSQGFVPCRNVLLKNNRIIFRRSNVQTEVNVGGGTEPESFRFENNHWFAEDQPKSSKPRLPTPEKDGHYGDDPRE